MKVKPVVFTSRWQSIISVRLLSVAPHSDPSQHRYLVVGLYIEQVCLSALFWLKVSIDKGSSIAEGVLMLVLVLITAAAQIMIRRSFNRELTL